MCIFPSFFLKNVSITSTEARQLYSGVQTAVHVYNVCKVLLILNAFEQIHRLEFTTPATPVRELYLFCTKTVLSWVRS
jgi:hypothetical protein